MRSLICLEHPNWDATLKTIQDLGGKAGIGTYWPTNSLADWLIRYKTGSRTKPAVSLRSKGCVGKRVLYLRLSGGRVKRTATWLKVFMKMHNVKAFIVAFWAD
jgi:hypothetical protein